MKKLAALVLTLFAIISLKAEPGGYDSGNALNSALADIPNWMKYLPDDVFVAHISIPGTHDSATGEGWSDQLGPSLATTQSVSIDHQLESGIRAFDFRPGLHGQNGEYYLNCDHGMVATTLRFHEAIRKLVSFLDTHPTEFLAIHLFRANVRNENDEETHRRFNELINTIFNTGEFAEYFVGFDPELRVEDVRGKIIVFRRDKMAYADIHRAGNLSEWPSDKELWTADSSPASVVNASDQVLEGKIRVTDVSSPKNEEELNTELESIRNLISFNAAETKPNEAKASGQYRPVWTMLFTSGCYPVESTAGYLTNATKTNPLLIGILNGTGPKGPLGIVFSDWVLSEREEYSGKSYDTMGSALVQAIIAHNFRYIGDYILDDALFGEDSSAIPDGEFFLRNIGSGQFIGAGGEWGTQAVLSGSPVLFSPQSSGDNEYTLRTTFRKLDKYTFLGPDMMLDSGEGLRFKPINTGRHGAFIFSCTDADGKYSALAPIPAEYSFADGSDSIMTLAPYDRSDPWQQWQAISSESLLKERLAGMDPDAGCNLSFMIRGTQFHSSDSENDLWLPADKGSQIKTEVAGTSEWNDRVHVLRIYNSSFFSYQSANYSWRISRDITGLPDGQYTLSVLAHAGGTDPADSGQLSFSAHGADMRDCITANAQPIGAESIVRNFRSSDYRKSIPVTVCNGTLSIEISGNAAKAAAKTEFAFRDLRLTYLGPDENCGITRHMTCADGPVSVYSVSGICLRHAIRPDNALQGLSQGLYIIVGPDGTRQKTLKR